MKLLIGICVTILLIVIAWSIYDFYYFSHMPYSIYLNIASFWATFFGLIVSIWTLCIAHSIKQAKLSYVAQTQHANKRYQILQFINQIDDSKGNKTQLSYRYIARISEFVDHIKCNNSCIEQQLTEKKRRFIEIVQNPRVIIPEQLSVILQEIHNIMEQDNAKS